MRPLFPMVKIETVMGYVWYKMFQPVEVPDMQLHQKYKVIGKCEYYGTFKGIMYPYDPIPIQYLIFDNVCNETHGVHVLSKLFISTCNFHKFVSQKARIQSDMEMRALNRVVQRIVGDDHFKW